MDSAQSKDTNLLPRPGGEEMKEDAGDEARARGARGPARARARPRSSVRVGSFAPSSAARRCGDRFLPVANIARIMKRVLPANEKIARTRRRR